ncbi:EamA family transporter [Marinobacter sp.]|uniref:DMT family transporter n=1 Tax=Marinobacter sp. TaxID=50741 RepID=UPI001B7A1800|nr:EamA family transporter [Marinobacter sp.]MBQ0832756.1 EamA family transporter [Marinobacter sp.]
MNTISLFTISVFIWGTTWIGISAQVGDVPITVSIFYRFALAGVIMLVGLALMHRLQRPNVWRFVVIQAMCLFCFNFIALYKAAALIPSGLIAVVFSLVSICNAINARLFFGDKISRQTVLAGSIGATGLMLIFWTDLFANFDNATLQGIGWAMLGTLIFSFGNMASRHNSSLGITPVTANSWGMGIGALALLGLIKIGGQSMSLSTQPVYWVALIYLSVIGSVVGFTTYLMLIARVGSARAGYATVMFPVIALVISTVFEDYSWTPLAITGVVLTLVGNVVMFRRPEVRHSHYYKDNRV